MAMVMIMRSSYVSPWKGAGFGAKGQPPTEQASPPIRELPELDDDIETALEDWKRASVDYRAASRKRDP